MAGVHRIAVVTGATSGIGRAIAGNLLASGHDVVLTGRREEAMAEVLDAFGGGPGRPVPVLGDLAVPGAIDDVIDTCARHFGRPPDLAVVNAGRGLAGTVLRSDDRLWPELIDVNITTVLRHLRAFAQVMVADLARAATDVPRDIIVLGSTVGRNVSPFNSVYGATKFAVHGAAEGLRREVGPLGVRVSLIQPGVVTTNFQSTAGYDAEWFDSYVQEIGPVLEAEDIARVLDFIIAQPAHVHVNDIVIRPTRQPYP